MTHSNVKRAYRELAAPAGQGHITPHILPLVEVRSPTIALLLVERRPALITLLLLIMIWLPVKALVAWLLLLVVVWPTTIAFSLWGPIAIPLWGTKVVSLRWAKIVSLWRRSKVVPLWWRAKPALATTASR